MKGPGYDIQVPWSVRITWSGDYLHDAPWSVGSQGSTNVSHGCVNMAPADAELYYKMELTGDPVTIVGSSRAGVWGNGWTDWFLPWPKYLQGSAIEPGRGGGPGRQLVRQPAVPAPVHRSRRADWRPAVRQRQRLLRQHSAGVSRQPLGRVSGLPPR